VPTYARDFFGTSFKFLLSPGTHVCSGLFPGGLGHAVQCTYVMLACDDANECICMKTYFFY
jgi:hypothetical protein